MSAPAGVTPAFTVKGATGSHAFCGPGRIVVHGDKFSSAVVPSSAKAFNFQLEYRLTEEQVSSWLRWSHPVGPQEGPA